MVLEKQWFFQYHILVTNKILQLDDCAFSSNNNFHTEFQRDRLIDTAQCIHVSELYKGIKIYSQYLYNVAIKLFNN